MGRRRRRCWRARAGLLLLTSEGSGSTQRRTRMDGRDIRTGGDDGEEGEPRGSATTSCFVVGRSARLETLVRFDEFSFPCISSEPHSGFRGAKESERQATQTHTHTPPTNRVHVYMHFAISTTRSRTTAITDEDRTASSSPLGAYSGSEKGSRVAAHSAIGTGKDGRARLGWDTDR